MNKIGIDQILKLAKRDDHPFGNSLIIELQGLVLVRGYSDLNASEIAGTYSTKYYINQKFTKVPTIHGWLPLIPNLEKLSETNGTLVRLIPVQTEQNEYLHFTSLEMDVIYGVLQFKHIKLDRKKELTESGELRGTWGDYEFFDNFKLVKKAHNTA